MGLFSKSEARKFDGGDVVTVVGPEAYFNGVLTVRGSLRVEGEIEGNINEAQTVIVGRKGRVQGDVAAERVVVGGSVEGDIVATVELELISGGRIVGNIRTPKLLIEEGSVFEGRCVMNEEEEEASSRKKRKSGVSANGASAEGQSEEAGEPAKAS